MLPLGDFARRRGKTLLIWAAALLAAFAAAGFFLIPPILKSVLTTQLSTALHREVAIREVRFNPFALSATVRGFTVKEAKGAGTFASFEELYVNLETSSLFRWGVVIGEVRLTRPFIRVLRHPDETYNFSDLLPTPQPQPAAPAKPLRFSVSNIRVIDGGADIDDELVHTKHTIREVNVGIPFLSNIPSYVQIFVRPAVSARINQARYATEGKTKPFADSLETALDVSISDLDLPYYLAYVPKRLLTFAMPSGRLDAKLAIVFVQPRRGEQTLSVRGEVGLRDVAIDDAQGGPVVRIPSLSLGLASVEPFARKAHLSRFAVESPALTVRREKTGVTNLEMLVPTPGPEAAPAGEAFALDVDEISIRGATVSVSDLLPRLPFKTTLAPIDVRVRQLSTRRDTRGTYDLTAATEAKEQIAVEGGMSLAPLTVDGKVSVQAVPLKRYAPYYGDLVLFDIEAGKLDLSTRYRYAQGEKGPDITASETAVSVTGLRLRRRAEPQDFVRLASFAVKDTAIDVTRRQITVGEVATQRGFVAAKRLPGGEVDLQHLMAASPAARGQAAPAAGPEPKPWVLVLKRVAVEQYAARLEDLAATEPIVLTADRIRLHAENLSTVRNATGRLTVSLSLDQTAALKVTTAVGVDPLRADGKLEVAGVDVKRYAPYYKGLIAFDVQDGVLDMATSYRVAQARDALEVKLTGLGTSLRTLRLKTRDTNQEFASVQTFAVKDAALDLAQRDVTVGHLSTAQGVILVTRSRQGEINLAKLLLPTAAAASPEPSDARAPASTGTTSTAGQPARPWTVRATAMAVDQYRIQLTDEVPSEPVTVTADVSLKAENLSTAENQPPGKVALALRLDKGTVSVDGAASVAPVTADLQVAVKDLDIRPFQPYVTEKVKVTITEGRVSAGGRLELGIKEPRGLQARFTGDANLAKFSAIEKVSADEVLKWESLAFQELSAAYNPLSIRARKVALADFFAHVIIQPSGRLNLQEITGGEGATLPAAAPTPAAPPTPSKAPGGADAAPPAGPNPARDIQIEEVTLQGGQVQFQDRTLTPSYSAILTGIGGRVSGLSSTETSVADVELRAKMNNSAPLEITGKVNPLKQDLFVDLRARFTGMDLSPASPYSGKYVGYSIEKGKLSFDLAYRIDKRKLASENKIFVDQFTFGEKVDSPQATRLPVKLAVALLRDRNGEIHLDIPVTGSIDDPKFSIWRIILQIIGNLITKAVTSPFALLGAMFGGGEDMQYVEFDPGRAAIPDAGRKKIDALVTALSEKPSLTLEIAGYVSPEADREGLKQYFLQRKVKAQKLGDMVKTGAPAVPVDEIVVAPEEYEKYLTRAYRAEPFPKPRNVIGMVKSLPVAEMEKLMLTNIQAGDEELRQLATRRANAVKDALLQSGKVEAERMFIVEPKGLTPEKKDKVRDSRVEFKIA
jgi:uncharacterized protein involved in outer membrane biogenesis